MFNNTNKSEKRNTDDVMAKTGQEMGQLFNSFFGGIEALRQAPSDPNAADVNLAISSISSDLWTPRIERQENEHCITLRAHLPNVPNNQVRIDTSTKGRLKIYGESNSRVVYESGGDRITERQLGQIEKDIPLPPEALVEQIAVLDDESSIVITIPKAAKV
ncbi:hypothetical protein J3B02_003225 [Coemansia erecta]|uniref:SHSP domain-containing protein n=1 Tax=Coemansia asiatica TaxID=1052880 RepID=A0A9W7XQ05_9FUNG|nr:hypothetical protein LPJ64_001390 [Coemansia asiatica]KAJ2853262.1 hypothetical protein J3B02_003225 [Coemansia erecta]KAJ2879034.1 hypothetical protein FB639_003198 [Coemansia asiatica]